MEPQKNRNLHYLQIRIPGIQASKNLGNLGYAYTLRELGCVRTLGELGCVHTLGELGCVHTLGELGCVHTLGKLGCVHTMGGEGLAAVSHWKILNKIIQAGLRHN